MYPVTDPKALGRGGTGCGGIYLLFLDLGGRRMWVVSTTPVIVVLKKRNFEVYTQNLVKRNRLQ
jgi:hypothetical protein